MTDDPKGSKGAAQAPTDSLDAAQRHGYLGEPDEWAERCRLFRVRCAPEDGLWMARLRTYIEEGLLVVVRPDRFASRTDGAAASVQKPTLGHQIGASAEKPAAVDGGRAGHPTYLLESLTDESGTDHAVSLLWHGKFYSKWSKSAKRAERVAKLLRDEFGFANRDELSTPPSSSDEQGKVGKGVTP